jgi:hypothetical protein
LVSTRHLEADFPKLALKSRDRLYLIDSMIVKAHRAASGAKGEAKTGHRHQSRRPFHKNPRHHWRVRRDKYAITSKPFSGRPSGGTQAVGLVSYFLHGAVRPRGHYSMQ